MMTVLDYALGMAKLGYPVYPTRLTRRDDGTKEPIAPVGWRTGVSTDPEQIRSWFAPGTRYNAYMIDCEAAGIVVADLDVKTRVNKKTGAVTHRDGPAAWREIGGHNAVMVIRTESGGLHLYFRATPEWSQSLGSDKAGLGIDIQGVGKCVFGPGSEVDDGGRYAFLTKAVPVASLTPVPHQAIERGQARRAAELEERRRARLAEHPAPELIGTAQEQAATRVNRAWETLADHMDGGFNDALNALCYEVGRWFGTLGREEYEARDYIIETMASHPVIGEADRADLQTISSTGIANGLENPWEVNERYATSEALDALIDPGDPSAAAPDGEPGAAPVDSWTPVDIEAILSGEYVPEQPGVAYRADGVGLLYAGKINAIIGESESGKSWFAQDCCRQVLADPNGGDVVYVDYESSAADVVGRLMMLGVPAEVLRVRFRYVHPDLAAHRSPGGFEGLLATTQALVVVDGVTDALGTEGLSLLDNDEIGTWHRRVLRPLAVRTGAAVLLVDHVTKSADARGRFAIGGQHKISAIDGAALLAEVTEPFGRGMRGVARIRISKDRPGGLRPHGGEFRAADRTQDVAVFVLDASQPGNLTTSMLAWTREDALEEPRSIALPWDPIAPPEIGQALTQAQDLPIGGAKAVADVARWMASIAIGGAGRSRIEVVRFFKDAGLHSRGTVERAWDRLLEAEALEALPGCGKTGRHLWAGPVSVVPEAWLTDE